MSDTPETPQKTPLSSSSSAPSGTQALSVAIEAVQDEKPESEAKEEAALTDDPANGDRELTATESGDQLSSQLPEADSDELPVAFEAEQASQDDHMPLSVAQDNNALFADGAGATEASAATPVETGVASTEIGESIEETAPGTVGQEVATVQEAATNEAQAEKAVAVFTQISENFRAAMDDARADAALISGKLMEFAKANLDSNMTLARDYADVRSVPQIFDAQASYFKRQVELLNKQTDELRQLTADIASKKAAHLQNRMRAG